MWVSLVTNLAAVALVVLGWNQAQLGLERLRRPARRTLFALAMGAGAVASMLLAVPLQAGVIFDLRSSLIALAAFIGGAPAAFIAAGMAAAYRVFLGGPGAWAGLLGIAAAAGVGLAGFFLMRGRKAALGHVLCLAACVAASGSASIAALPAEIRGLAMQRFGVEISLFNFAATSIAAIAVLHMMEWAAERELLRAALAQAPDYQFVKNRRGEFIAVNGTVAEHNGFPSPADMRGRTDFDITLPGRAQKLWDDEQEILRTGLALLNLEERITPVNGPTRWFSTSKSALRDGDGTIIGLAGVTRDVTEQKQAETSLALGQDQFRSALEEVSDGVALFGADGWMIYANSRFREHLALGPERQAGLNASDLVARLEADFSANDLLLGMPDRECQLPDLRWLRFRSLPEHLGLVTLLVADVTREKETGRMLDAFTATLHSMADGTTGLPGPSARRTLHSDIQAALAQAGALQRSMEMG